ncbi:MAG: helix-turn-helix domain containing protein [Pseudoprimorskyibacter sp.]|nr:helix-turn-helix domain containing protein [Pseudoprimorskyibacter sp.]
MIDATKPTRGRPPRSDRPDTRNRILDAALEVFSERGFEDATVRQIAAKVGVSDPAFYAHFKSKKEIFEALIKLAGPDLLASAGTSLASEQGPMRIAIPQMFGNIVAT